MGSQTQQTDRVGLIGHDAGDGVEVTYQPNREEPTEPKPERETFDARVVETQQGHYNSGLVVGLRVEDEHGTRYRVMRGGCISRFEGDFERVLGHFARVDGGNA